ncbi:MAG: NfeD family protein [Acidobacteriota bacterium]|nr:hypothetical protein [Blastocatellia bacterium]MDW8411344.1 NfeD family protein [Acidobacteriota bacterium]
MLIGIILILLGITLLALEMKVAGFGILGALGTVILLAGLVAIFGLSTNTLPMLASVALVLIVAVLFIVRIVQKARSSKVTTGEAGMIGLEGTAESDIFRTGKVKVRGELWDAYSTMRIERGTTVKIVGIKGLRLEVAAASPEESFKKLSSVVNPLD